MRHNAAFLASLDISDKVIVYDSRNSRFYEAFVARFTKTQIVVSGAYHTGDQYTEKYKRETGQKLRQSEWDNTFLIPVSDKRYLQHKADLEIRKLKDKIVETTDKLNF